MFKNAYSIGYLPEEMVRVNRQDLTFECTNFRAYIKSQNEGYDHENNSSGGGQTVTSSSEGSTVANSTLCLAFRKTLLELTIGATTYTRSLLQVMTIL
jgi:translation initiation factor RLI1